jgi:hypothetical protein
MLTGFPLLLRIVYKRYCNFSFELKNYPECNPCFIAGRKRKEENNKALVSVLKDTRGIYFLFSSCVCAL